MISGSLGLKIEDARREARQLSFQGLRLVVRGCSLVLQRAHFPLEVFNSTLEVGGARRWCGAERQQQGKSAHLISVDPRVAA